MIVNTADSDDGTLEDGVGLKWLHKVRRNGREFVAAGDSRAYSAGEQETLYRHNEFEPSSRLFSRLFLNSLY